MNIYAVAKYFWSILKANYFKFCSDKELKKTLAKHHFIISHINNVNNLSIILGLCQNFSIIYHVFYYFPKRIIFSNNDTS